MKNKNCLLFLLAILFVIIIFFSFSFYFFDIPMKSKNYDYYSILGTISGLENYFIGNFNTNFFPNAEVLSPHTNFATLDMLLIKMITNVSLINMSFIYSILTIILFIFSSFLFIQIFIKDKSKILISIILLLVLFSSNITRETIGNGLYNLSDILLRAFSYQLLAFSIFLLTIVFIFRYFSEGGIRNLILVTILSIFLFNLHLQIFSVLLFSIIFILLNHFFEEKKDYKKVTLLLISLFIAGLFGLLWSFYNWPLIILNTFTEFQKGLIASGAQNFYVNNFSYYLGMLSFSLIGYFFILKEKNKFLKYWVIGMTFLILVSLINIGFKIPFFQRYLNFIQLGLIIIIVKNINFARWKKNLILLIPIILIINFLFMIPSLKIASDNYDDYNLYKEINQLGIKYSVILSDPQTSNLIQSTTNYVLFIPEGHIGNPTILIKNNQKIKESKEKMVNNFDKFILDENISYIVLDKSLNPPFIDINNLNSSWINIIYENGRYKIIKIEIK